MSEFGLGTRFPRVWAIIISEMLLTSYMGTRLARVVFILIVSIIFLSNVAFVYWTIRSQRCPVYTSPVYDAKKCELLLSLQARTQASQKGGYVFN